MKVAEGSIYMIEIKRITNSEVVLSQDNGQNIVLHLDDLNDLIDALKREDEC